MYYISVLDLKQNPLGSQGIKILSKGIARSNSLVHLDLRSTAMRKEAADSLFKALCLNKTLVCLHLGNVRGLYRNLLSGKAIIGIKKYLKTTMVLTFLELKGAGIGNEGLQYVYSGLIGNKSVKVLDVSSNNITGAGSPSIIGIMVKSLIKRLDMSHNPLGNEFVTEIYNNMKNMQFMLTHLSLSSCGFIGDSLEHLFHVLKNGMLLEKVDISNANFEESDLSSIIWFLTDCTSLKFFNLADCHLGDKGARYIATALTDNSPIEKLNLSRNRITNTGVMALTDRLATLQKINITSLDLSYNWIEVLLIKYTRMKEE